jgi:hypothetical protein
VFQKASRKNNQNNSNMVFDNMNLERIRIKLNDAKQYPENEYTCDFTPTSLDYLRVYTNFLAAGLKAHDVDTGTVVSRVSQGGCR